MANRSRNSIFTVTLLLLNSFAPSGLAGDTATRPSTNKQPQVAFQSSPGKVAITIGGTPLATYVYQDDEIWRPYFAHVRAPGRTQITRNHPPKKDDLQDHPLLHPGIFLGFRDLSGHEYWHKKAKVVMGEFVEKPKGGAGKGTFAVRNRYLSTDGQQTVCEEVCQYTIAVRPSGVLLIIDSTFTPAINSFSFGDSEEMGLGVRLATSIAVDSGKGGQITDSEGRINGSEVWGKQADWCDYSGTVDGQSVGVTLMPDLDNFRRCWWHARDYGFLVANPFGRNAFTKKKKSKVVMTRSQPLHLRFGVLLHDGTIADGYNPRDAYADFLNQIGNQ